MVESVPVYIQREVDRRWRRRSAGSDVDSAGGQLRTTDQEGVNNQSPPAERLHPSEMRPRFGLPTVCGDRSCPHIHDVEE